MGLTLPAGPVSVVVDQQLAPPLVGTVAALLTTAECTAAPYGSHTRGTSSVHVDRPCPLDPRRPRTTCRACSPAPPTTT